MRNQMYPPPPPGGENGKETIVLSPRRPLRGLNFALAACIILAACEAPTTPENRGKTTKPKPPPTAPTLASAVETTISGKVTQQGGADAGNSVPGVSISAAGQNVKVVGGKPAVTNAQGSYSLKVSHRGSFTLTANKGGFESKSLLVTTSRQAEKRDFALIPIIPLNFEFPAVRKSKMLISTNSSAGGSSTQTFTNPLRLGTDLGYRRCCLPYHESGRLFRSNHRGPRHRCAELRPGGLY